MTTTTLPTREQINSTPAGPQMDAWVAEYIMGLKPGVDFGSWDEHDWRKNKDGSVDEAAWDNGYHAGPSCRRCYYSYCAGCNDAKVPAGAPKCEVAPPAYSTSIALVWKVVEKVFGDGFVLERSDEPGSVLWEAGVKDWTDDWEPRWEWPDRNKIGAASTPELAICRAALFMAIK